MKVINWPNKAAVLSRDGMYRYRLDRHVDDTTGPMLAFLMLNPSTADGLSDDPTVRRCKKFAFMFGYHSIAVVNLYAYRTPHPDMLRRMYQEGNDIVGPDNDFYLLKVGREAREIVFAWGSYIGPMHSRARQVTALLEDAGLSGKFRALGWTAHGEPRHPLFMPDSSQLNSFRRQGVGG